MHIVSTSIQHLCRENGERSAEEHLGGIKIGGRTIGNVRYAHDVVLIATGLQELLELTDKVKITNEAIGLFLNVSKTKVMKVTQEKNDENLVVDNQNVENVDDFKYLGIIMTNNLND